MASLCKGCLTLRRYPSSRTSGAEGSYCTWPGGMQPLDGELYVLLVLGFRVHLQVKEIYVGHLVLTLNHSHSSKYKSNSCDDLEVFEE